VPFTPFHMGPGIIVKALLQGSFSLMVFGWTQIVMDVQPLIVILTGEGQLHGFTHTYVGATLIAAFSALTGKYLSEWALMLLRGSARKKIDISWRVAVASALVGSYSHVALDSIMHGDMEPLFPLSQSNPLLGIFSVSALHQICVYSGLFGAALYFAVHYAITHNNASNTDLRWRSSNRQ
jgi:hypothetical protein